MTGTPQQPTTNDSRNTAYCIYGPHGGYFLIDQTQNAAAVAQLAGIIRDHPNFTCTMDFEAYTLDRMAHGARLEVEQKTGKDFLELDTVKTLRELAQAGRLTIVSTYTQPLLFALDGESVVRQFVYARKVVRDTLGVSLEAYGTQEPCWCGQIPAILQGCGITGALFTSHWAIFGLPPIKDGEKLSWRGPDGSVIPVIPLAPYAHRKDNGKPYGFGEDGNIWANRWGPALEPNAPSLQAAIAAGVEHPVFSSLAADFYPGHVAYPTYEIPNTDIVFTTIPRYLELACDGGVWEDAFAEFTSYLCWGKWGGEFYRDAHAAANMTVLAERLEVLSGADWITELDDMRVLTMLAQHHDAWVCAPARMGQWREHYSSLAELVGECRREIEQKLAMLLSSPAITGEFTLCNPTQRQRKEWTPIAVSLPEGADEGTYAIADEHGRPIASRLRKISTGDTTELRGYLLADIPPFSSARYTLMAGQDNTLLPIEAISQTDDAVEIANDRLRVLATNRRISVFMNEEMVVSDVHLDARVDGAPTRGVFEAVRTEMTDDGIARAIVTGHVADIPCTLVFELKPWSDIIDIQVTCTLNGQLIEGADFSDMYGNLKLWLTYPQPVDHLANQAFELRKPSTEDYWAVHYSLSTWKDGTNGCVAIHDRPTGVIYQEKRIGISLCHSGNHPYGLDSTWMRGFGHDRVYGERTYRTSLYPFSCTETEEAVCKYQTKAYPITVLSHGMNAPWVSNLHVEGHSVVTGLYRNGNEVLLRFWNPFTTETVRVSAPGFMLSPCDLEGNSVAPVTKDQIAMPIEPMQIRTVSLRKA